MLIDRTKPDNYGWKVVGDRIIYTPDTPPTPPKEEPLVIPERPDLCATCSKRRCKTRAANQKSMVCAKIIRCPSYRPPDATKPETPQ